MRIRSLALAAGLLAASPVMAQAPDPMLQGLAEVRLAVGFVSGETARRTCQITPETQRDAYDLFRARAQASGVAVPPMGQATQPEADLTMLMGGQRGRNAPLLLVSASIVELRQDGRPPACAVALMTQLRGRVQGRVEATGREVTRDVILWHEDSTSITAPEGLAGELLGFAARHGEAFARTARGVPQAGPAPAPRGQDPGGSPKTMR